jgi:hypothetical protein
MRARRRTVIELTVALGACAAVAAIAVWIAQSRWDAATRELQARLAAQAAGAPPYGEAQLHALPAPVQRWLRRTLTDGQRAIVRARVHWAGEFNLGAPGADRWVPFTAVQDFVPGAPGFVWDARMRMAPGVTVRVRDALVDGGGQMRGAILGLLPVVDKAGTEALATASLRRYLGEAMWFPTALLPQAGVRWTALDESRALATIGAAPREVAVEFRFGADGRPTGMYAARHIYDNGRDPPSEHPWQGRYLAFTQADGIEVPAEAVVEWLFPQGGYAYWKARPVRIEYEYAR